MSDIFVYPKDPETVYGCVSRVDGSDRLRRLFDESIAYDPKGVGYLINAKQESDGKGNSCVSGKSYSETLDSVLSSVSRDVFDLRKLRRGPDESNFAYFPRDVVYLTLAVRCKDAFRSLYEVDSADVMVTLEVVHRNFFDKDSLVAHSLVSVDNTGRLFARQCRKNDTYIVGRADMLPSVLKGTSDTYKEFVQGPLHELQHHIIQLNHSTGISRSVSRTSDKVG